MGRQRVIVGRPFSDEFDVLDEAFYYFYHIDERDDCAETFLEHWERIPDFRWDPKQISNILSKAAEHIAYLEEAEPEHAETLRAIMLNNWHCWEEPALRVIDQFKPINLSLTIRAHRLLGVTPSPAFKKHWLRSARDNASEYSAFDFRDQIADAASLGIYLPQQAFQTLLHRIDSSGSFVRRLNLGTELVWAMAIHHAMRPLAECAEIAERLKGSMRSPKGDVALQKMQHDVEAHFGWEQTVENPIRTETTSNDEIRFREALERAGIKTIKKEGAIPGFNQAIDFTALVEVDGSITEVDMEQDGITHFNGIASLPHAIHLPYKGKDLFRSRRFQKAAPEATILRMPYTVSDIIFGDGMGRRFSQDCRDQIAGHFVKKAAEKGAGLHRATIKHVTEQTECPFIVTNLMPQTRARSIHSPSRP